MTFRNSMSLLNRAGLGIRQRRASWWLNQATRHGEMGMRLRFWRFRRIGVLIGLRCGFLCRCGRRKQAHGWWESVAARCFCRSYLGWVYLSSKQTPNHLPSSVPWEPKLVRRPTEMPLQVEIPWRSPSLQYERMQPGHGQTDSNRWSATESDR